MKNYLYTSFGSGELSSLVYGRPDIKPRQNGSKLLQNAIILPEGAATRRKGSKFISTTTAERLIPFESVLGNYLLAFANDTIYVYRDDALVDTVNSTGYLSADIPNIKYTVDDNTMFIVDGNHVVKELNVTAIDTFTLTTYTYTPAGGFIATFNWDNDDIGTPNDITIYEGRLIFLTNNYIMSTDVSNGSDYLHHFAVNTTTAQSTDSIELKFPTDKGNEIRWIKGADSLYAGASTGLSKISNENELLSPTGTITRKDITAYPSSKIKGIYYDGQIYYIQDYGKKVRVPVYSNERRSFTTLDMISTASHLTENSIVDFALRYIPNTIMYFLLNNGSIISFSTGKEFGTAAWSRYSNANNKSIAVLRSDPGQDFYILVDRNGTNCIEKEYTEEIYTDSTVQVTFGSIFNITSAVYGTDITLTIDTPHDLIDGDFIYIDGTATQLDGSVYKTSGITDFNDGTFIIYDEYLNARPDVDDFGTINQGTVQKADSTITGLSHLEGEYVYIMHNLIPDSEALVSGGSVEATTKRTSFNVGLNYTTIFSPLYPAEAMNLKKRIIRIYAQLDKSIGGKIGHDTNNIDLINYNIPIIVGTQQPEYTGNIELPFRGVSDYNGDIVFVQDIPLPLTVVSLTLLMEVF